MRMGKLWGMALAGSLLAGTVGCAVTSHPLAVLPIVSPSAAEENLLGITAYNNGDWEQAKTHFSIAVQADPRLAEAHFNLALTLHKLGDHDGARQHFQKAGDLAPSNKAIIESTLYRNHLGLSTTLERHLSGGYRY